MVHVTSSSLPSAWAASATSTTRRPCSTWAGISGSSDASRSGQPAPGSSLPSTCQSVPRQTSPRSTAATTRRSVAGTRPLTVSAPPIVGAGLCSSSP